MNFSYEKISRKFPVPVKTATGIFPVRESILVSLTAPDGNIASGECAPWQGFGSETLDEADAFLRKLNGNTPETIPATLPCLAHAFSAAHFFLKNPPLRERSAPPVNSCAKLLRRSREHSPEELLADLARERENGYSVFKVKIGLGDSSAELDFCEKLLQSAPRETRIRLDANGSFSEKALPALVALSNFPALEFVEQPLSPSPENDALIFEFAEKTDARFALDESVREPWTFPQNSRVVAVVKPLLVADFPKLLSWLECPHGPQTVISTIFENTPSGKDSLYLACSRLAENRRRAFGLG